LHSSSAAKTIDRIIDVFPTGDKGMVRSMLSSSLQGVVAQTLLRKPGGAGRVAAHEILVGTNAVRNLIRENQIPQMYSMMQTGSRYGMVTMEDSVLSLLEQGIIDEEEARTVLAKASDEEIVDSKTANSASPGLVGVKTETNPDPDVPRAAFEDKKSNDDGYSF
jgi:twitching motility protein PilT